MCANTIKGNARYLNLMYACIDYLAISLHLSIYLAQLYLSTRSLFRDHFGIFGLPSYVQTPADEHDSKNRLQ